ncbi:MAG: molecular chaperone HtpG [Rhodothermales bacterium]
MAKATKKKVQEFEYKAEMKQLLHLIVHSLYTHKEIFLRELVSNASDALNKARFRMLTDTDVVSKEAPLEIKVSLDKENNLFSIEDTGIGMSREDLVDRIGTVASSGTKAFLEQLNKNDKPIDGQLIGQFGVGFYSVFMVADEVVIETRNADPDSKGYRWKSDGSGTYTLEEIEREQRGTKITIHLKEEESEFAEDHRVRSIIQKYSNFVDFPITIGEDQANTVKALWRKNKSDVEEEELVEFYKFISNDFMPPMGHLHLNLEGVVSFRALLFIPEKAPPALFRDEEYQKLHLYSNNVFIQDDCKDLLPDYLKFVRGVVDTDGLPLNVSREVTQSSPVMAKIRSILTGKVLGLLEEWAKKDADKYIKFFKEFGPLIKTGVSTDFKNKDKIIDLFRFPSTKTEEGQLTSFKQYVEDMGEEQTEIYYLLGEHLDVLKQNPNLEYFKKNNIEVLLMDDPVDSFAITHLEQYADKPIQSIEKADLDIKKEEDTTEDALAETDVDTLIAQFKITLEGKVEDVIISKRLVDSAVTLVVGKTGMDSQMERMLRMMDANFAGGSKILEINTNHELLKNLSQMQREDADTELIEKVIEQLYEGALLIDGNLNHTTDYVTRMTELMVKATTNK